jgi:hypothetical protein
VKLNFKPGDLAIISPNAYTSDPSLEFMRGQVVELIKYLGDFQYTRNAWQIKFLLSIDLMISETLLIPLPGPSEKGSWENCVWKPKELELV